MKLCCPLCGAETEVLNHDGFDCTACHGYLACVPNGKAWMLTPLARPVAGEEEIRPLLDKVHQTEDPKKQKALLDEAAARCPNSLAVQRELLLLGDLWKRDGSPESLYYIKFYLLHAFESPDAETPERRAAMLAELTSHPQLEKCLSMTEDNEGFIRDYLTQLCRQYIAVFLKGSNRYNHNIFGFSFGRLEKSLAYPAAKMLRNMEQNELPEPYRTLLPQCFLKAFQSEIGDDSYLLSAKRELEA